VENIIFSRSYRKDEPTLADKWQDYVFQTNVPQLQKKIDDFSQSFPKFAAPEWQQQYDKILNACDEMMQRFDGEIYGEVNYENWTASICLTFSELALFLPNDFALLSQIANSAISLSILPAENGQIQIKILLRYFAVVADAKAEKEFDAFASDFNQTIVEAIFGDMYPPIEAIDDASLEPVLGIFEQLNNVGRLEAFMELYDLAGIVRKIRKTGSIYLDNAQIKASYQPGAEISDDGDDALDILSKVLALMVENDRQDPLECYTRLIALIDHIIEIDNRMFFPEEDI